MAAFRRLKRRRGPARVVHGGRIEAMELLPS